ncbi:hypothetical protein COOONC_18113 [Cooperia oncophora]
MGSCVGLKCAGISMDTLVPELDIANNYTGITYCTESCGGWGCSCGFPSSGCLFYRIYHVPVDDDVHEVFQCLSWYETIKLKIEQQDRQHNQRTFTGEIKPYTYRTMGDINIEVTSFAFSHHPLLSKRFLSNNRTTVYLDDDTTFTYACTSKPSISNTSINSCSIQDTCKCSSAEDTVSCYCAHNDIQQIRHLSKTLPLPLPNGIIKAGPKNVPLSWPYMSLPSVLQVEREVRQFTCNVVSTTLTGCYNCYKGAVALIDCTADVPQSTAQVTCGIRQFVLTCTREGYKNHVKLFFNRARVREQCRVQCGSQVIIMELHGTLNYINGIRPFWRYTTLGNQTIWLILQMSTTWKKKKATSLWNQERLKARQQMRTQAQERQHQAPPIQHQAAEERVQRVHDEEVEAIHRKVNRILGRTDEIHSIRTHVLSNYVSTLFLLLLFLSFSIYFFHNFPLFQLQCPIREQNFVIHLHFHFSFKSRAQFFRSFDIFKVRILRKHRVRAKKSKGTNLHRDQRNSLKLFGAQRYSLRRI